METLLQLLISGVALGSIYGLVALGFLVIFHATGLVNFSQGEMLMVGSMTTYVLLMAQDRNYGLVVIGVVLAGLVLAAVFRFGLYEPLRRKDAPMYSLVVATIAFGLVLTEVMALLVGNTRFGVDPIASGGPISFGGVTIGRQMLAIVGLTWLLVGAVWLFFNRSLTGMSLRAVGINRTAAAVSGVRVGRLVTIGFAVSIVITGIAGLLIAPVLGAGAHMGLPLAVKGFGAAVLGGMSSVYRGMVAGLGIGMTETLSSYYVSSAYAPVIAYSILLVALVLLPAQIRQGEHA